MKNKATILLLSIFFAGIIPAKGMAQNSASEYIISQANAQEMKNQQQSTMPLTSLLATVEKKMKVSFIYEDALVKEVIVSAEVLHAEDLTLELNRALQRAGLTYQKGIGNIYIITSQQTQNFGMLQNTVQGHVTDADTGETLPGVNIVVKGTTTGTSTDATGLYEILVPSLTDTLTFTSIGYRSVDVPIEGRNQLDVVLESEAVEGETLVVVGYGMQREISLIGAQSTVQVAELRQPTASLSTTLSGRLAGVVGVQRSGQPGHDAADIWIRGISTFGGNSSRPLILVDGVERPMNSLNPNDIETLTILKDASATAVYGSRGGNGVILIETKQGIEGRLNVEVDYFRGVSTLTQLPEMADGVTYMRLANEALTTRGGQPIYSEERIQNTLNQTDPYLYPNIDWIDTIFNNFGANQQANVNISGGSPMAQYYVSLSYYNEKGLFINDNNTSYNTNTDFNKYNVTANLNVEITPTTQARLGIQGYLTDGRYPGDGGDRGSNPANNIFSQAHDIPPVEFPITYPNNVVPGRHPNGGQRNPYYEVTHRGYTDQFENQLFSNLSITQQLNALVPGLSARGLFSFDTNSWNQVRRNQLFDTYIVDPNNPYNEDGSLNLYLTFEGQNYLGFNRQNGGSRKYYIETSLNYYEDFGRHNVTGLLLYNQSDFQNAFANDFTAAIPSRTQGLAFRGTYSFDDRYFFEMNFGYTGSEDFASNNRYGFFPSAGIGWVISNERFFEPLTSAIQFFKIRYSDGFIGDGAGGGRRFAYLTLLSDNAGGYTYGINRTGMSGIDVTDYGVNVGWAESRMQDLGIEIKTFNERLSVTVDFFKERRDGIFLQRSTVPSFVGLTNNPYGNLGITENKGIDGSIEFNTMIGQDFMLGLRGNATYNRDKIIDNDQPPQPYPWMDRRGNNITAIYGFVAEGLFESQEEIDNHARQFGEVLPGDIKYKDLNGDGVIDSNDITKIGRGDVPYLTLGFAINAGYKSFDFGAFFQGQFGADRQISGRGIQPFHGDGGVGNLYQIATDRWTEENPNPNATYPRLGYGSAENTNNFQTSSFWNQKINFVRLKTLEVGYSLPYSLLNSLGIGNARIYFRGTNLLTFSNFDLWDPELNTSNGMLYPNTSVYSVGINMNF